MPVNGIAFTLSIELALAAAIVAAADDVITVIVIDVGQPTRAGSRPAR